MKEEELVNYVSSTLLNMLVVKKTHSVTGLVCCLWTGVTASCPGTLTYGTGSVGRVLLQKFDDLGLLSWGAAAADNCGTLTSQLHKLMLIIPQTNLQQHKETNIKTH